MSPLSIFSGAAGLIFAGGAVYGIIGAVQYGVGLIEQRQALKIETMQLTVAAEYRTATFKLSQQHANELAAKTAEIAQLTASYQNEIAALRDELADRAMAAPFDTGNDIERRLAHRMCLISRGADRAGRETCDRRAAGSYTPDQSIVVTVTPEIAERWQEECDDGRFDTCDYAIFGLTTEGALMLLSWAADVDRYQVQLNDYIASQNAVLKELSE